MKTLTVATRSSALAIAQTQLVIDALKNVHPDIDIRIRTITTEGDRDTKTTLWQLKGTGFFTSRIEQALLEGKADFAVHSFKDLPTEQPSELTIAAVCSRDFPEDVIVSASPTKSLNDLPSLAKVGTSSPRRKALLKSLRIDIDVVPIRGNVHTRLKKLEEGLFDAVVLARAGLERLGLGAKTSFILDTDIFIPAPAQGALAVQARSDDKEIISLLTQIDDKTARLTTSAERTVLARLHPGCHVPVGVFAKIKNSDIIIDSFVSDLDGEKLLRQQITGPAEQWQKLAQTLVEKLIDAGAEKILKDINQ